MIGRTDDILITLIVYTLRLDSTLRIYIDTPTFQKLSKI